MTKNDIEKIPEMIRGIYAITNELSQMFERSFTPDGHLVGSIGEVLAAYHYGLELFAASTEGHDAKDKRGRLIQIKATQGESVGLRSEPRYLIVLKIKKDGTAEEIFNGPGDIVWRNAGKVQKNGQRPIRIGKLKILMDNVQVDKKITRHEG